MRLLFAILLMALPAGATEFTVAHRHMLMQTQISAYRDAARSSDRANVIYLHGFGDTFRNHTKLFGELRAQGLRLISFDYPSHGNSGGVIAAWDLYEVAEIISSVLDSSELKAGPDAFDSKLPLILMGWSTGATMAIRIAQDWSHLLPVPPSGVVAFAPGIPVYPLVFAPANNTLARDPSTISFAPKPAFTLSAVRFSADLLDQSLRIWLGQTSALQTPTLVLVGGDQEDQYVYSKHAKKWVKAMQKAGQPVFGYQCPGAYHGIEFEPQQGSIARRLAASFALGFAEGDEDVADLDPAGCPRL